MAKKGLPVATEFKEAELKAPAERWYRWKRVTTGSQIRHELNKECVGSMEVVQSMELFKTAFSGEEIASFLGLVFLVNSWVCFLWYGFDVPLHSQASDLVW